MKIVEITLPNALPRGFDYRVPEEMQLQPGDYVLAPFGGKEMRGIVWGAGKGGVDAAKIKPLIEHYSHLPPMREEMRQFIDWVAWYTLSPVGGVIKMSLPVAEALKAPGKRERAPKIELPSALPEVKLSPVQMEAAERLKAGNGAGFSVTLLDGVTGSGKTEVYFDALADAMKEGGQVLVMLPEIALSVQWLERFAKRFGCKPHVWHSGLPAGQRKHTWRAIVQGEAKVVVGARSALFLPFRDLRAIVADEEHDASYKQEDGVIYHARDMAVARASMEKIPVILVSATPSVETLWNAAKGKYHHVELRERHAGATFAEAKAIDMRKVQLDKGAFISAPLREALAENLGRGQQSMLFLNRRGYAPLLLCRACGYRFQCPHCTAWLVLHRSNPRLQCHHCGAITPIPHHCPECAKEGTFHPCGPGVERVAEEVKAFLPEAELSVLTSDAIESFDALQERIAAMEEGKTDIMIGTQIVAKGHHFANLTLVGIVDADLGLTGGDLRSSERTYQLLHQLSGRAGREKSAPGVVMIQTFLPTHPVMQALLSGDRDAFMEQELEARKLSHMPPFTRLVAIIIEGEHEEQAMAHARDMVLSAPRITGLEVLGPAPAPLSLLRGRHRYRILVKAERSLHIQKLLGEWMAGMKHPSSLRIKIDIDPYSFM